MRARWLLLVLSVHLAGCAGLGGFPKSAFDPRLEEAELATYVGPEAMTRYEGCTDKVACRNMIIDARVRAVDLHFYRFIRRVYGQEAGVGLGSDLLAMGLDSIAAVTGATALAAGAGAITGGRDAYERQVLAVSLPLLMEEMVANRRALLLRIRQGEAMPVGAYTLFQALSDISEYELAGSIPNAASELATSAGSSSRNAQALLDAQRAATFASASTPVVASVSIPQATTYVPQQQQQQAMTVLPPPPPAATAVPTSVPNFAPPPPSGPPAAAAPMPTSVPNFAPAPPPSAASPPRS